MDRRSLWVLLILLLWSFPASASHLGRENMKVVEVIHGDTLKVLWKGKVQTLILLGADTPPALWGPPLLRRARLLKIDPHTLLKMGKEAKKATQRLIPSQGWIYVEFDWIKRDPQGRLMGYVYVPQGMLNAILIAQGYARARLSFPFPMRPKKDWILSAFPFLEKKAKWAKRGLWKYGRF